MKFFTIYSILLILGAVFLTSCISNPMEGFCAWGPDCGESSNYTPPEYQTRIIRVDIEPNPVVAGDSVTFTCIIRDSLNPDFYYRWKVDPNDSVFPISATNTYSIKSTDSTGTYTGVVYASNDDSSKEEPVRYFDYEVIPE